MIGSTRPFGTLAAAVALAALGGCGGGGNGSSGSGGGGGLVTITPAPSPSPTPSPVAAISEAEAVRLARQATFGPNRAVVDRIVELGATRWIDEQLGLTGSTYADIVEATNEPLNYCTLNPTVTQCNRNFNSREPVAMRFYANAMVGPDQLRQRVAWALSQLLVASEVEVSNTAGIAAYQQILLDGALGNYRDILQRVTLSGYMGNYLDMANSNRTAPSENYAREMLQLFSMGPDALNMDGTPRRDATGGTVPNYSTDDIKAVSRALTGWVYGRIDGGALTDGNAVAYWRPMVPQANRYDTAAKSFFGTTVPAGATPEDSVKLTVDAAFNHQSTAPYVSKFLIVHLVTPNPTPAYVGRVAAIFANNGAGVRGDMKAVVRAILNDPEARGPVRSDAATGKVKEPVLILTSLMRAAGMTTDGYPFVTQDAGLSQGVFRAPSVFNFYPPDYPLPGNGTLKSPVSKLITTSNVTRIHNLVYAWTVTGDTRGEFTSNPGIPGWSASRTEYADWEALGTDTDAMIARINTLMTANQLTDAQKAALKAAANAITNTNASLQARRRAQMLLYIVGTSPLFLVDR